MKHFSRNSGWGKTKPPVGSVLNPNDPLGDPGSLVACYLMNEGAGLKLKDIARTNHGNLTGFAVPMTSTSGWRGGKFGTDLAFDGTNDYVNLELGGGAGRLSINGPLTLSAWINTTTVSVGTREIISNYDQGTSVGSYNFELNRTAGKLDVYWANAVRMTGNAVLVVNTWYHVAMTRSGSSGAWVTTIFINGVVDASSTIATNPNGASTSATDIGAISEIPLLFFSGLIDIPRIYNRALLPSEVSRLCWEPFAGIAVPRRKSFPGVAVGITFDAVSNSGYNAASNTDTWSHTNAGNYLIVGIPMLGIANATSVTFNGDALTLLGSATSAGSLLRIELWGRVAPDIGTFDIVVNLDAAIAWTGVASSWTGVHQTSPTEGFNSATATNVGAADATVGVTSIADNCMVVDVMAASDGSVTVGAGQTQRNNVTGAAGSGTMSSEGPKTPAGVVTMSWTDVGAAQTWVTGGIALRPLAAADLTTGQPARRRGWGIPGMAGFAGGWN